jgi:hypothetical protein
VTTPDAEGIATVSDRRILEFERQTLQHELDYRRGRRADILKWGNAILVAVTGGAIGLQSQETSLTEPQRLALSASVAVVGVYSTLWWTAQRRIGSGLRSRMAELDHSLGISIPDHRGGIPDQIGGGYSIVLLTIVAIIAIWLPA